MTPDGAGPPDAPLLTRRQVVPTGLSASTYQGYADFRRGAPLPLTSNAFYNVTWIPVSPL